MPPKNARINAGKRVTREATSDLRRRSGTSLETPRLALESVALGPNLARFCKSIAREGCVFGVGRTRGENNELSWPWSHLPALYNVRAALSCLEMRITAKSRQVLYCQVLSCGPARI